MKIRKINRFLVISSLFAPMCSVSLGFASWEFSSQEFDSPIIGLRINDFNFGWTGSDTLDEMTYEYSCKFSDALNGLDDPESVEGQALAKAIEENLNRTWLGNNDTNTVVASNLNMVLDVSDNCTYLITINSDGSYCLYVTYDDLSQYCDSNGNIKAQYVYTGRNAAKVKTYKTLYTKDSTGKYVATQSWVGTCTLSYYDRNYTGQKQPGLYSGGFINIINN